jgi:pimeloyl-ACP methyl ester carboxylesterase
MLKTTTRMICVSCFVLTLACGDDDSGGTGPDAGTKAGSGGKGGSGGAGKAGTGGAGDTDAGTTKPVDRSKLSDVGVSGKLDYGDPALWMCRPDNDPNECHRNLDATEIKADGMRAVVKHEAAKKPEFDCFFVYPTVLLSGKAQMTDFTDEGVKIVDDPLLSQGARFSRVCEVYAPLYRQTGLSGGMPVAGADSELATQDVRDAFAYYLKNLNRGRKFVLIGHSQGTFMLTAMMQMDIDNNADVRKQMISALLIGGRVVVPTGKSVGGTFQNIPTCTAPGENGCVIAYVSYAAEAPPTTGKSLFGMAPEGNEAACVDPAVIAGNSGPYKGSYFPVKVDNPSFNADVPVPSDLSTPFVLYRDVFKGKCVTREGFHYLEYSLLIDAKDPRGIPPWRHTAVDALGFGTHLVDFHVALEDLIEAVTQQAAKH